MFKTIILFNKYYKYTIGIRFNNYSLFYTLSKYNIQTYNILCNQICNLIQILIHPVEHFKILKLNTKTFLTKVLSYKREKRS